MPDTHETKMLSPAAAANKSRRAAAKTLSASKSSTTMTATKSTVTKTPPAAPSSQRTVAHITTQLQGQMAHHTGYVPHGGVLMALHAQQKSGTVVPPRPTLWQRCFGGTSTTKTKQDKKQQVTVRLLDESEW